MNEELKSIFGDAIAVGGVSVPTAHLRYRGASRVFVTWHIIDESCELYADDEPLYSAVSVDVNVFSEGNYGGVVTEIKKLMKNNGWIWVEDSAEMFEEDTQLYHKTITFAKEGVI